ncbi:MAG TPA: hypothetical protein PLA45_02565 [Candidatus Dojkabacteria bacterium]|nr:hypothetical protein [Candidatus Dojkabacteria bacterium]
MKTPTYTITNLILSFIVKYELAIKDITHYPLPEKYLLPLQEKYGAEDLNALGDLVGNTIGYNKSLQVQRGQELASQRKNLQLFINIRNAKDYINSYTTNSSLKPSIELSSHLNKLAMKGLVDDWDLAKLKTFSEKPNEIYDTWFKMRDYYPHIDSASHFNEIFEWIKDGKDSNHKLIKFAALTYEFIDKAPYFVGNQITAILTLEILAKQYGYNPDNLLPFFKSINNISQDLLDAFKISKSKRDLTTFIEAFLYAISLTAIDVSRELKDTYTKKVKKQGALEISLNPRQIKVMDYITLNHKITRSKYTKMMGVSFMTSYRDLQEMVDKGYIKQKGQGRGTFYVLSKEQEDIVLEIE